MENFFLWAGFIGSWFLFAGPIYQAALELQDEDIEFDRLRTIGAKVPKHDSLSAWYWLIFPLKIYIEYRRNKSHQRRILKILSRDEIAAFDLAIKQGFESHLPTPCRESSL